jgi:hypothetical protein
MANKKSGLGKGLGQLFLENSVDELVAVEFGHTISCGAVFVFHMKQHWAAFPACFT